MQHADIRAIYLLGTHTSTIVAEGLHVQGDMRLIGGFVSTGEINLLRGIIDGDLDCHNCRFINPDGNALNGDGIRVGQSIFLHDGFVARGEYAY